MTIQEQNEKLDAAVAEGAIVAAVEEYFATNATTKDYANGVISSKAEMLLKMQGFVGAIARVNRITRHHSIVNGNVSASEFTFDFDMQDGSKIFWHEIIRRIWNENGQVVQEEYFNAA